VEIFNRDLSAEEIQAIYNAGITGKCKKFGFATDLNPNTFSLMNGESQTFANALPGTYFVTEDLPMG
jgi:hypothetical protein